MSGEGFNGRPSQAMLDNIALPSKIKCHECDKNLVAARFSNNQLKKYQERIYKNGELKAERPRCQPCMGVATGDDKFCNDCGLYKGREEFSKSARKKGDNAVCVDCQQRILDQEPKVEDAIKETEIEEDYHRKGASVFNLSRMGSSVPSASKKSSNDTPSEAETDDSGKVWITEPLSTGERATAPRGRTQQNTSDENARRRSSSQVSAATEPTNITSTTNGTWAGYINGTRVVGGNTSRATDKWHKQGAVKKNAVEKVMAAVERQKPKNEQRQKDSDDDSDFEM